MFHRKQSLIESDESKSTQMHAYYILRQIFQSWPQEMNCAIIGQVQSSTNFWGADSALLLNWCRVCGVHNFDA